MPRYCGSLSLSLPLARLLAEATADSLLHAMTFISVSAVLLPGVEGRGDAPDNRVMDP